MNQFGTHQQLGLRDMSGSIQSSFSTWRRTLSSSVSKARVFTPTLSCHHIIMAVCLSPASDTGLPDVEPTALLLRACKPWYFWSGMRRLMGKRLSWHQEYQQSENRAKKL